MVGNTEGGIRGVREVARWKEKDEMKKKKF